MELSTNKKKNKDTKGPIHNPSRLIGQHPIFSTHEWSRCHLLSNMPPDHNQAMWRWFENFIKRIDSLKSVNPDEKNLRIAHMMCILVQPLREHAFSIIPTTEHETIRQKMGEIIEFAQIFNSPSFKTTRIPNYKEWVMVYRKNNCTFDQQGQISEESDPIVVDKNFPVSEKSLPGHCGCKVCDPDKFFKSIDSYRRWKYASQCSICYNDSKNDVIYYLDGVVNPKGDSYGSTMYCCSKCIEKIMSETRISIQEHDGKVILSAIPTFHEIFKIFSCGKCEGCKKQAENKDSFIRALDELFMSCEILKQKMVVRTPAPDR